MSYKKLLDMHTHTDNSPDGTNAMMYMCEYAEKMGLRAIAFTDHCEVDNFEKDCYDKGIIQSYFETIKARSIYRGRLIVCSGVELGQPTYNPQIAEKVLKNKDYDIILGSIHNLRSHKDFYYIDYSGEDVDELLSDYFNEVSGLVDWGNFDVLAHLTYPLRYITGVHKMEVDLNRYHDIIEDILEKIVKRDIALEVNTSGLRQQIGQTLPDADIIKRYRELGGLLITIGSDAHRARDIGAGIEDAMDLVKSCGFKYVTLFQKRSPILIPIE